MDEARRIDENKRLSQAEVDKGELLGEGDVDLFSALNVTKGKVAEDAKWLHARRELRRELQGEAGISEGMKYNVRVHKLPWGEILGVVTTKRANQDSKEATVVSRTIPLSSQQVEILKRESEDWTEPDKEKKATKSNKIEAQSQSGGKGGWWAKLRRLRG